MMEWPTNGLHWLQDRNKTTHWWVTPQWHTWWNDPPMDCTYCRNEMTSHQWVTPQWHTWMGWPTTGVQWLQDWDRKIHQWVIANLKILISAWLESCLIKLFILQTSHCYCNWPKRKEFKFMKFQHSQHMGQLTSCMGHLWAKINNNQLSF